MNITKRRQHGYQISKLVKKNIKSTLTQLTNSGIKRKIYHNI